MDIEPKIQHGCLKSIKLSLSSDEFLIVKDALIKYSQSSESSEMNELLAWKMVDQFDKEIGEWKEDYLKGENNSQKIGYWIPGHVGQVTSYHCSICGRFILDDTGYDVVKDYPYCNCGVKMDKWKGESKNG